MPSFVFPHSEMHSVCISVPVHVCALPCAIVHTLNIVHESTPVSYIPSFYFAMETGAVSIPECISLKPDEMEPYTSV